MTNRLPRFCPKAPLPSFASLGSAIRPSKPNILHFENIMSFIYGKPVQKPIFLEKCLKLHSGVWVKTQVYANFFHIRTSFDHASTPLKNGFLGQLQQKAQIFATLEAWSNDVQM